MPLARDVHRRAHPRRPSAPRGGRRYRRPLVAPGAVMSEPKAKPVVAVVGRPNVGKSTLVNRIVGRREAIVQEEPGVTRDRKVLEAEWAGREFRVVDTGGWLAGGDTLDSQVSRQAERAIGEADVVLLLVDATVGITDEDERVVRLLRRDTDRILLIANK